MRLLPEQWAEAAYRHFCKRCGLPEEPQDKGFHEWAKALADSEYYSEDWPPEEAVDEELSYV